MHESFSFSKFNELFTSLSKFYPFVRLSLESAFGVIIAHEPSMFLKDTLHKMVMYQGLDGLMDISSRIDSKINFQQMRGKNQRELTNQGWKLILKSNMAQNGQPCIKGRGTNVQTT